MSSDFEVGTNVSCEESTVSLRTGLILLFWVYFLQLPIQETSWENVSLKCPIMSRVGHKTLTQSIDPLAESD